ncbi:uncharacterized protein LY89DRAFT_415297 [Mollisia scopiformis]|uniref:Uncharacterized protein n=1 Tax=Mollisia scopiformis TaxID=149040 RepID=A0A132B1R3_MOLSC|nr:uncharacterized protein LY89DRAFT_415297 [Mollisia scopiformis]KUJ06231.1 hypothetical protein LY89DRAFT_415297 [Mollisia scopiformis]
MGCSYSRKATLVKHQRGSRHQGFIRFALDDDQISESESEESLSEAQHSGRMIPPEHIPQHSVTLDQRPVQSFAGFAAPHQDPFCGGNTLSKSDMIQPEHIPQHSVTLDQHPIQSFAGFASPQDPFCCGNTLFESDMIQLEHILQHLVTLDQHPVQSFAGFAPPQDPFRCGNTLSYVPEQDNSHVATWNTDIPSTQRQDPFRGGNTLSYVPKSRQGLLVSGPPTTLAVPPNSAAPPPSTIDTTSAAIMMHPAVSDSFVVANSIPTSLAVPENQNLLPLQQQQWTGNMSELYCPE